MLLLAGCASNPYMYRAGSQASEDNQLADYRMCDKKADDAFFNGNHGPTWHPGLVTPIGYGAIASLAIVAGSAITSAIIPETTSEYSKPGPIMTGHDIERIIHKCMADKGYIYKG